MKAFETLISSLDGTAESLEKLDAIAEYFSNAADADRVWAIALLTGKRPKRIATSKELQGWAAEEAGLPMWLFEESYTVAGDMAETIALILPDALGGETQSLTETLREMVALAGQPNDKRKNFVVNFWRQSSQAEKFIFNKLLTGGVRAGVSGRLVRQALAKATGIDENVLAQRLISNWDPNHTPFELLISGDDGSVGHPYSFASASPLEGDPHHLGEVCDWAAEWKWDGLRGQIIFRNDQLFVWSKEKELLTDRFPEFSTFSDFLPQGTAIDGEILAWKDGRPLPFTLLQKRIGRNQIPKRLLSEIPVQFVAYDLLEKDGIDQRNRPFSERRKDLEALCQTTPKTLPMQLSPLIAASDWRELDDHREASRSAGADGLMLKRRTSPYFTGRQSKDWWKWKVDPYKFDAVMIYAQVGQGRRSNQFSDFTFAIQSGNELLPITKACSGLSDPELSEITQWVQRNSIERFGPVRRVSPELVFGLAFDGIEPSPRHKSGLALRSPRILRWRKDKTVGEIDSIETLRSFLPR